MLKQQLRKFFETKYPDQELNRWFDPLEITLDSAQSLLRVTFPHALFGQWFMDSIGDSFEQNLKHHMQGVRLEYAGVTVNGRRIDAAPPQELPSLQQAQKARLEKRVSYPAPQGPLARHTFNSFLVNKKNDFPFAVANRMIETIAKQRPPEYTPVVLYGQSGSGKTHLLGAMANALYTHLPAESVYFGSAGILLMSQEGMPPGVRALFLDDTQQVRQNQSFQERLVSVLDTSQATGHLVALSLDAPPVKCAGLNTNLLSRLTGGLIVELKKPDIDIRRQYIEQKNTALALGIHKKQQLELAQRYQDFRGIDGALSRVVAYRSLLGITDADINSILDAHSEEKILTASNIIRVTAQYFSVNQEDMLGKVRHKQVTVARQVAMFLIRELLGFSLAQIGRIFTGRDHSSVLYTIKKIKELQVSDNEMHNTLSQVKHLCLTEPS